MLFDGTNFTHMKSTYYNVAINDRNKTNNLYKKYYYKYYCQKQLTYYIARQNVMIT